MPPVVQTPRSHSRTTLLATIALVMIASGWADWPTYRHDPARSGYTPEPLPARLALVWSFHAANPPEPAWPSSTRMTYDRACQPVVAAGLVCFGDSADGQVYALDAATGAVRWVFPTDAPVRFAPAYGDGHFFVVSDDGHLYGLEARTGALRWKKRGAPNDELVLGNGRMISRWPARGGPVVLAGMVYFAAGIWPSDGVFLYALDAASGEIRWVNDTADQIYMGQPHGGAYAHSGIAPQGYLAATANRLFVPNGRAVPAAFRLADGRFEYFHLQSYGQRGGGPTVIADRFFVSDGLAFAQETGATARSVDRAGAVVALPDGLLQVTAEDIRQYRWTDRPRTDRPGEPLLSRDLEETRRFTLPHPTAAAAEAIVAREEAILGLEHQVRRVHLPSSNEVWSASVRGTAYGLAAAAGRLYVSTDQGVLYCFADESVPTRSIRPPQTPAPPATDQLVRRAATEILEQTRMTNGYCLDLGCGDGALALELARASQLRIVAVDADPAQVSLARARMSRAGLPGGRVTVLQRELHQTGLPLYFANLVVSGRSLASGAEAVPRAEAARLQRPYGGALCLGRPGDWFVHVRGPLEGAGEWTHQYANPANTLCSNDALVNGPLGMLWFADVEQRLVQRHGRPPAPLFKDGILYSEGWDSLLAVDAYNGTPLWEYALPGILEAYDGDHLMGTSGTGSNFALSDDGLYVRRDNHCLRLDPKTGQRLGQFVAPAPTDGSAAVWGFIACDDGVLYGSLADPAHVVTYRYRPGGDLTRQLTQSKTLFAMDARSGALKWRYDAQYSLRHNTIAIGAGRVILIDRPLALYDREQDGKAVAEPSGELVALDAQTGTVLWRNAQDIYGTLTLLSAAQQKVLMGYQPTRFSLASELGGRMTCFALANGQRLWERELKYHSRPILNDGTIYAEGGAWDLETGAAQPFPFQRSYGCGILASAKDLLVFRSATLGYYDLEASRGTEEFGGMRPGCWVNALPAGGLVLVPDSTAGCVCSYPNQAWLALRPDGVRPPALQPAGGMYRQPVTVDLAADRPAIEQVHYTLDGTVPTTRSTRYREPITLAHSSLLQARAFGPDNRASRLVSAQFTIDPAALLLAPEHWQTWDAPGSSPASEWGWSSQEIAQTANTLVNRDQAMSKAPAAERPGTLQVYQPGREFRDGEFSFQVQSVDNDTVGVAFRLVDPEHHYLWLMDSERAFRALTVKDGPSYTLLAAKPRGYLPGQWYNVRVRLEGPRLTVYVDDERDLVAEDARFATGTVALYAWGNAGVTFRHLRFQAQ